VSARSYLSIGDVLTLLRQEFPDVTISKIRFLESQGLVNPERTPSGYRKFYEHDVERLRWVLRQQREHFLPLKVIKDRLDEDANGSDAGAVPTKAATRKTASTASAVSAASDGRAVGQDVGEPDPADPSVGATVTELDPPEPVLVGHRASGSHPAAEAAPASTGAGSVLPAMHSAPVRTGTPPPATAPGERTSRAGTESSPRTTAAAPSGGNGRAARAVATGSASGGDAPHTRPTRRSAAPKPKAAPVGAAGADTPATTSAPPSAGTVASPAAEAPAPPSVVAGDPVATAGPGGPGAMGGSGGASLSLDELCASSGLRAEYVGQLQEYGLLHATMVGGSEYFDEEALTVANVAAKFAAYGIEARHLRLYKNAADREAGFIEQVVVPMVRQRNPEARARATQTAADLAYLGQQLKGSLLRTALRDLLKG
jgi:DNA-binding transcriptional MerR regulator